MALRKHNSVVVLEIISSFALIGTFAIALMLFFIHKDLSAMNVSEPSEQVSVETPAKKITLGDLSPELINKINSSFSTLDQTQKYSGFYLGKLLEKQFSKEEIKAIDEELKNIIENSKSVPKKDITNTSLSK